MVKNLNPNIFDLEPELPPAPYDQAEKILAKFGGARRLSFILQKIGKPRDPATIYKWTYPRERGGTDGVIPTSAWPDVLKAARLAGVLLTMTDFDPNEVVK